MVSVRAAPCSLLLPVFVLICLCRVVSSLYFHVNHSEVKCFTVEMANDTLLLGSFGTRLYDAQTNKHLPAPQDFEVQLEVKDPDDELVLSQASSSDGKFNFTSHEAGVHQICLQPSAVTSDLRPPSAGGTLAIHVDVTVARGQSRTNRYAHMTYTRYISELMLKVLQLAETSRQIHKEQEYQTIRLERFRDVSHNTETWIFWWPVIRSLYVVAIIIWHTQFW